MSELLALRSHDFAAAGAALGEAVMRLRGAALHEELGRIARTLLASPQGSFTAADPLAAPAPRADAGATPSLRQDFRFVDHVFGSVEVAGRLDYDA